MSISQKRSLYKILLATALFVISLVIPAEGWIKLLICLVPYIVAGYDVLAEAAGNILRGQVFDEKFLMAIASIGAFAVGEYHEAVFVMVFFQIGELFESVAVGKIRRSVAILMDIRPDYANVMRDGQLVQLDPDEISVGDVIVVKPGERIPLDGIVTDGVSSLNTTALTGESLPKDVGVGDSVVSGCVNLNGILNIKVTKHFSESTVSKILELVEESAASKSKSENFITHFARWYTPIVVVCAALLAVVPPLFVANWPEWIHRALIFLVISCPCALVISVPLTYFGGIGKASRNGILVKGSNYLDTLTKCDTFVFDKTGTLTKGSFNVRSVVASDGNADALIELAAMAEGYSDHPIAESVKAAYGKKIEFERLGDVNEIAGCGVCAIVDGAEVLAGNSKLMESKSITYMEPEINGTAVHIACDGIYCGYIIISDEIKEESPGAVAELSRLGIKKTVMLTGDDKRVADAVGSQLGINEVYSRLLPADKVKIIEQLLNDKESCGALAFVGDGMNDAPSLSRADLGIAMGALGSDAAIEAADIVLMDDNPAKIPLTISIAVKTKRIVIQNIAFALGIKFAVLILGAMGHASMWAAAFADVGVCVIAIMNAMRTLK